MDAYGPVPVSRLKAETSAVYAALEAHRSVLISRHGRVVAVIEPASIDDHAVWLARYALAGSQHDGEVRPTELAQGSVSELIRLAEVGTASYVTRDNKVYGRLCSIEGRNSPPMPSLEEVVATEASLARFEAEHPEATLEDFLAAQDSQAGTFLSRPGDRANDIEALISDLVRQIRHIAPEDDVETTPALRNDARNLDLIAEALVGAADAYLDKGDFSAAVHTYRQVIERFARDGDPAIKRQVATAIVHLAGAVGAINRRNEALEVYRSFLDRFDQPGGTSGHPALEPPPSPTSSGGSTSVDAEFGAGALIR